MKKESIYRVVFMQGDQECQLFARFISEDSLIGFIEVEGLIFSGGQSGIVVDAAQEKLKQKYKGVQSTFLPLHNILRIDVVDRPSVLSDVPGLRADSNVTSLLNKHTDSEIE